MTSRIVVVFWLITEMKKSAAGLASRVGQQGLVGKHRLLDGEWSSYC